MPISRSRFTIWQRRIKVSAIGDSNVAAEQSSWVRDVGDDDFQREVIERSREKPVVVDFWATWCPPCRTLGPILEGLINERKGEVLLAKVDVDKAQRLAYEFGIEAIPVVLAFRDGQVVLQFQGLLPEAQIRTFLDRISPTEADRAVQQARTLESDNPQEADKLYRQALAQDKNHDAAMLGLARVLIARNEDSEASDWLERVTPGGDRSVELDRLRATIAIRAVAREFAAEADLRGRLK